MRDQLLAFGEAPRDTIQAPEIGKNFGWLPVQLLECLRQLPDRCLNDGDLATARVDCSVSTLTALGPREAKIRNIGSVV